MGALLTAAAALGPREWGTVTQNSTSQTLEGTNSGAGSGSVLGFGMEGIWDDERGILHFCGSDHGDGTTDYYTYTESSNNWARTITDVGLTASHGYDHLDINPSTGDLFLFEYGNLVGPIKLYKLPQGGSAFSLLNNSQGDYVQVANGSCWWSGSMTGGGAGGTLVFWSCGSGILHFYNPATNIWFATNDIDGATLPDHYHGWLSYCPILNVGIFGPGNGNSGNPNIIYRLDSDRSVTQLTNSPLDTGVRGVNVCREPVTGGFILMGANKLYYLDPTGSGTYTLLNQASDAIPSGVEDPSVISNPSTTSCISFAVPSAGVIVYVSKKTVGSNANMSIYKYATIAEPPSRSGGTKSSMLMVA